MIRLTIKDPVPVVEALPARLAVGSLSGRDDPGVDRVVPGQRELVYKTNCTLVAFLSSDA